MEYDDKSLKISAKIAAASLSESGDFEAENAKKTVLFVKTVYNEIFPIKNSEDFVKYAFKAAGKIQLQVARIQNAIQRYRRYPLEKCALQ